MSDRFTQFVFVCLAIAAVSGAAMLSPGLDRDRRACKMVYEPAGSGQQDATYRIIENLGSLRGIAVNILWTRFNDSINAGRFYEADPLGRRITELQPRMPEVWRHLGYNLAYNLSVKCQTQEERWSWVQKGIRLLKEEGIPNNPDAEPLYRELANIYHHKIASESDDMNRFYKKRVAEHWQLLLGVPSLGRQPKPGAPGETEDSATAEMRIVADAARDVYAMPDGSLSPVMLAEKRDAFFSKYPDVAYALERIEASSRESGARYSGLSPALAMATGRVLAFAEYSQFAAGYDASLMGGISRTVEDRLGADGRAVAKAIQNDPRAQKGLEEALPLLRACAIIEQERQDPRLMLAMMEKFGPLDWRHPQSQAIYWAYAGAGHAGSSDGLTKLNTDRLFVNATQGLMDAGRISYDPLEDALSDQPDPRFINAYDEAQQFMRARALNDEYINGKAIPGSIDRGEENFLHRAIQVSFLFGDEAQAQVYYDRVKKKFPDSKVYGRYYNLGLPDFVVITIHTDTLRVVQEAALDGLISRGLEARFLDNNPARAALMFKMASETRNGIEKQRKGGGAKDPMGDNRTTAVQGSDEAAKPVPSMEEVVSRAARRFLTDPSHTLRQRATVFSQMPAEWRMALYDDVERTVYPQVKRSGLPVLPQVYFPPPEGLAEYRKARAARDFNGSTPMPNRQ